jgi:hypothetical protein
MSDEIQTNISRLAFKHGITLGHLNETGGRELECVLERFDAQADEIKSLRARVEVLERVREAALQYLQAKTVEGARYALNALKEAKP